MGHFTVFACVLLVISVLCLSEQKDFMSAELSDGRVKVSYDLGSGTDSIISDKRYNDGKWMLFTMSRMKKEGTDMRAEQRTFSSVPSRSKKLTSVTYPASCCSKCVSFFCACSHWCFASFQKSKSALLSILPHVQHIHTEN